MKGNTLSEFMDDLLTCGGPEKEFTFRGRQYFMEARYHSDTGMTELYLILTFCFGRSCCGTWFRRL